jgi:hypothetical protein
VHPAVASATVPETDPPAPLSALPSPAARAVAYVAILVGGLAGALIGFGFAELQCTGDCTLPAALGAAAGAILAAAGTAVIAVLVLRAMGEWRQIGDRRPPG